MNAASDRGGFGATIRRARWEAGLSRYERGLAPLTDVWVLRLFAAALAIPPQAFGLAALPAPGRADRIRASATRSAAAAPTVAGEAGFKEVGDPVRRRQLLASLALTAAAAAGASLPGSAEETGTAPGELLVSHVRDAMLGLGPRPADSSLEQLRAGLASAHRDFHACQYQRLADALPA